MKPETQRARRERIESKVQKQYGVSAPFPPAEVRDRWIKWKQRVQLLERIKKDVEYDRKRRPEWLKRSEVSLRRYEKAIERLKVPEPYLSWEHIGAFFHAWTAANRQPQPKPLYSTS